VSHSDDFLVNPNAMAGVAVFLSWLVGVVGADANAGAGLSTQAYMFYLLALGMRPRMLVAVEGETLEPRSIVVRVGQAMDVVGQAGKQTKTITGFQTHNTPVLVGVGERAELSTEDWHTASPGVVLEGVVIVEKTSEL
jgi:26S proteasome regulatory subunit N1